jgi:DNA invertase Pin-like site-specific DNA recombinase
MSLQALSVTQVSRLTRSGRSNCRQAADLIVAAQQVTFYTVKGGGHGFRDATADAMRMKLFAKYLSTREH